MAEFFHPPPPPSPKFSCSVKTLDESSPTAPIRALVAHSLAISSPIRQIQSSPPAKSLNPGESSSPPPSDTPFPANLEEIEFTDSSITPPAQVLPPNNSASCSLDDNLDSYNRPEKSYIANHHDSQIDHRLNLEAAKPFDFSWQSMKRELTGVGAGLYNSGNTCFIASVLQCFTHTVPLIESLRTYKYPDPCNCGNEKFCVLQALQKHVYHALKSSGFSLRIDQFRDNLNHFSPDFQINNQEDAHEFLQSLLDKLERCCLDRRSQPDSDSSPDVNIVDQIFGGRLLSRLHCCNCNSFSDTFEPSLGWSLEIEDVDDLYSALESFTCVEKLEDQFTCENCKEKVSKEKQLKFDKLPPVATFHLKRFKNDGHYMEKIFNHVKFPLELDLLPYMSDNHDPQVSTKYHLYAMVEHLGNGISFGHYSSYVRSAPETWHNFDDAKVTKVSEETVLSEYAYMLFYAREGTPLFASAFEELKTLFGPAPLNFSPKSVLESSPCREESVSDHSYENVCDSSKACNGSVVGVPIPGGNYSEFRCDEPQEEVFHSAECSSDSDSPTFDAFDYSPEAEELEKPFAETSPQEEPIAENRASVDDASVVPERKIQYQVPSPKRKAEERDVLGKAYQPNFKLRKQDSVGRRQGTFQIQRDHLQNKKKKEEEEEARGTKQQPFRRVSAADPKETEHAIIYLNRMPNSARSRKLAETLGATLKKKKVSNIKRSTMGLHRNLSERPTNANLGLN
uniref:Ubiquitin carboxyl-terminal hydrolase n=1 Tax=Noccaea caerulescens TaxID=107243 RepID=A0A1J3EPU8_NOCCA